MATHLAARPGGTGGSAGTALERYLYDPYGKVTIYDGTWTNTRSGSSYANPYLYTGREYDAETGLYHYRHRHYHAELGRFLSRDPMWHDARDMNLYRYVGDSPLTRSDPTGLFWPSIYVDRTIPGNWRVCGYSIFLLTGHWCSDPDPVSAATERYEEYMKCWWNCEVTTHKCVAGKILTATEVVAGTASVPAARVPKTATEFLYGFGRVRPGPFGSSPYTSLSRVLGKRIGMEELGKAFGRSSVAAGAKGTLVVVAYIELGISIKCAWNCS